MNKKRDESLAKTDLLNIVNKIWLELKSSNIPGNQYSRSFQKVTKKYSIEYAENASKARLKRLISSRMLKNKPTYMYSYRKNMTKSIEVDFIKGLVLYMVEFKDGREFLIKHSQGVAAIYTFDSISYNEKKRLAKRLLKDMSKLDNRLKKRVYKFCDFNKLKNIYLKEKNKEMKYFLSQYFKNCGIDLPSLMHVSDVINNIEMSQIEVLSLLNYDFIRKVLSSKFTEKQATVFLNKMSEISNLFKEEEENLYNKKSGGISQYSMNVMLLHVFSYCNKQSYIMHLDLSDMAKGYYSNRLNDKIRSGLNSRWC